MKAALDGSRVGVEGGHVAFRDFLRLESKAAQGCRKHTWCSGPCRVHASGLHAAVSVLTFSVSLVMYLNYIRGS